MTQQAYDQVSLVAEARARIKTGESTLEQEAALLAAQSRGGLTVLGAKTTIDPSLRVGYRKSIRVRDFPESDELSTGIGYEFSPLCELTITPSDQGE